MKSEESRNLILAIVLSVIVLIGWNYFFAPETAAGPPVAADADAPTTSPAAHAAAPQAPPASASARRRAVKTRAEALARERRASPSTRPSLGGSIDLTGGLIDDLILKGYRETIDPKSPNINLFSPPGGPDALLGRDRLRRRSRRRQDAEPRRRSGRADSRRR